MGNEGLTMEELVVTDTMFTITTPGGISDYYYADTMAEAFIDAHRDYGEGITIRPAWYGEWKCGTKEIGNCWYDEYGVHHRRGEETQVSENPKFS